VELAGTIATVFGAGLLSFFSPCILPLLPVYVPFLAANAEGEAITFKQKLARTIAFIVGLSAAFFVLGFGAGALGSVVKNPFFTMACGIAVLIFGLFYAGFLNIPTFNKEKRIQLPQRFNKRSIVGAFVLGLIFSLGWTPCVGPILASVLALAAQEGGALQGGLLLLDYSAGLGIPFLVIALGSDYLLGKIKNINQHMPKIKMVGGILLCVLGLFMIFSQVNALVQQANNPVSSAPESSQSAEGEEGEEVIDFTLYDMHGAKVSLSDYRGKPVYVEFWGTWCPVCIDNLDNFQKLADDYNNAGTAQVLSVMAPGINGELSQDDLVGWIDERQLTFPILLDVGGRVNAGFGVSAYPSSVLFDAEGVVITGWVGAPSEEELRSEIDAAIDASA